ncbi:MAG: hypothetical protein WCJ49_01130 [Deltaproteobacteria bacterium]
MYRMDGIKGDIVVRCLRCGTKNRIAVSNIHKTPLCGKCQTLLDEMIISCLHCGAKNRIADVEKKGIPHCGKCLQVLIEQEKQPREI